MPVRGVRGATQLPADRPAWPAAVVELLRAMVDSNGIAVTDLAAATFTVPRELAGARPAAAARGMGWDGVPLLELAQAEYADDPPRCLRVLLLWNTRRAARSVHHVYLGGAARLRPDLATPGGGEVDG